MGRFARTAAALGATALLLGACSSDDDAADPPATGDAPMDDAPMDDAAMDVAPTGERGGDRSHFEVVPGPGGATTVASHSRQGEAHASPRSNSVVREAGGDPQSLVEVEVGEVIESFAGEVIAEGTLLTLDEPILFEYDSAELRRSAAAALQEIAAVLAHYEDAPVQVIGHTDGRGSDAYNAELSQDRADAVVEALVGYGIDAGRLSAEGRGSDDPVAEEETSDGSDDPEGRAANRRVELLIEGVEPPS